MIGRLLRGVKRGSEMRKLGDEEVADSYLDYKTGNPLWILKAIDRKSNNKPEYEEVARPKRSAPTQLNRNQFNAKINDAKQRGCKTCRSFRLKCDETFKSDKELIKHLIRLETLMSIGQYVILNDDEHNKLMASFQQPANIRPNPPVNLSAMIENISSDISGFSLATPKKTGN